MSDDARTSCPAGRVSTESCPGVNRRNLLKSLGVAGLTLGTAQSVEARGSGKAEAAFPSARHALRLPAELRSLPPKPIYARPPDARAKDAA